MAASPMDIKGFEIFVYFEAETVEALRARQLMNEMESKLTSYIGTCRWSTRVTGPHPVSCFAVRFERQFFTQVVTWLSLNSRGLSVLIKPDTGNPAQDFFERGLWLGKQLDLKPEALEEPEQAAPRVA